MKPEIVITDLGGLHNADPEAARARIMAGSSWKRQRIIVILPADAKVSAKCMISWWSLAFPPNNGSLKMLCQGMEVGDAYSQAVENILAHKDLSEWEYVLTLEHDNAPPADGIIRLADQLEAHPELAAISGLYWTKGEGGVAQIWGDVHDPQLNFRPQPPRPGGLVECCGLGMGFCLFRLALFRDARLPRPLFRTKRGLNNEGIGTQDLAFWSEARKLGYRCAVDCNVKVGHWDDRTETMW
jgi:hypothetical protein